MEKENITVGQYRMFLLLLTVLLLLPTIELWAYPFPDTGQTKCYNNNFKITCPSPGQSFYGQDAHYNTNPRSYTKLDSSGNALPDSATSWTMVRDNVTSLIWEMKTDDNSIHDKDRTFTWCDTNPATNGGNQGTCGSGTGDAATDTEAFINALNSTNYGGYNDWRMPAIKELSTLYDYSTDDAPIDAAWFPNTMSSYYWSSTTFAGNSDYAWHGNRGAVPRGKSYSYYVRAVRGRQGNSTLVDNGNGTVSDTFTSLMWQKASAPVEMFNTWEKALSYCENLNLAGYTDWRLPDRNELQSLVDYSRYKPAIDPLLAADPAFTDPLLHPDMLYWSSTTSDYSSAWLMGFSSGVTSTLIKGLTTYMYVRAVRTIDDTTPDAFTFTDQTGVARSTTVISNTIMVSGINLAATISITNGEYSINGGSYTSASGTVSNGNTVTVRLTSSGSYSTSTYATLTIGGVSDTFSVTTIDDTTPNAFTFTDQIGVSLNTVTTSNVITVSGITASVPISINGGTYSINGGSYTSASGTVSNGNTVTVRLTSSGSYSTSTYATLTIGGVSDTFSVTTVEMDATPTPFIFTDQTGVSLNTVTTSNVITVSGITVSVSISITDGEYSISTDNGSTWGSWTNIAGTVALNNQVKVRQTSSISPSVTTDATLIIGGIFDTFSVTTKSESALGTIEIDPNPDSINAPWTLTGPNAFSHSFNGDAVEGYLESGEYTVTWGDVTDWDKPSPSTQTLAAGESITFTGTYHFVISNPPTSGDEGTNITIDGSNFGADQGGGYVDFNGVQGTIVSWSDTQIVVTVPYGATTGCLTVTTDNGTSSCVNFTVGNPDCYPPVKLSNYDYFNVVQDAYDNATDGNAVLLQTGTFIESVLLGRNITTILQGGYNCSYDDNAGYTTIDGSLTIKDGTVTVEKLIIK